MKQVEKWHQNSPIRRFICHSVTHLRSVGCCTRIANGSQALQPGSLQSRRTGPTFGYIVTSKARSDVAVQSSRFGDVGRLGYSQGDRIPQIYEDKCRRCGPKEPRMIDLVSPLKCEIYATKTTSAVIIAKCRHDVVYHASKTLKGNLISMAQAQMLRKCHVGKVSHVGDRLLKCKSLSAVQTTKFLIVEKKKRAVIPYPILYTAFTSQRNW